MKPAVLFLPGNGHGPVRLEGVRAALASSGDPFDLIELPYSKEATYDALLRNVEGRCAEATAGRPVALVYATGIGGLVALSMRARGAIASNPVVLQGAVLWGLERRLFPRLMRLPGVPQLLTKAFGNGRVRARFVAKHFVHAPSPAFTEHFFAGYGDAEAFANWFDWLTPALLRRLEQEFANRKGALGGVEALWGERDSVVGVEELHVTERALGVRIPMRTFAEWGHYPMIDVPREWVAEVKRVVDSAVALS